MICNQLDCQAAFFQMFLLYPLPTSPLSFLHSFLGALSTIWKLERKQN